MRTSVYLSGPVTGHDPETTQKLFQKAEAEIRELGLNVVNPLKIVNNPDTPWPAAMKQCIRVMLECHFIYMLPGWENSKGARAEKELASLLKIHEIKLPNSNQELCNLYNQSKNE
jgi:hypothetical protein